MASTIAATVGGDRDLTQYLPTIRSYMATLSPPPRPVAGGTFPGGMLWKLADDHYVVVLLPPCERAMRSMRGYFGQHFDGTWNVLQTETYEDIEALHVVPPWC